MTVIRSSRASIRAKRSRGITTRPARGSARPAGLDFSEGLLHQPIGVGRRDVALQDLRRDRDRELDRLVADALDRARGLLLDLALRVLDDQLGVGPRLLLEILAEAGGVGAGARDDRLRLDARLVDD